MFIPVCSYKQKRGGKETIHIAKHMELIKYNVEHLHLNTIQPLKLML